MKKDICDLTTAERKSVAKVFTKVRDHMIATYDTPLYITYICTNIITIRSRARIKDHRPYQQAQDIIDLRIHYDGLSYSKTVLGWLCKKKTDITSKQRYRIYSEPCLRYEYRIAWLNSLINECLDLPFETHYIESI